MSRPRTKYRNGDSIDLLCGCNSCNPSRINGVLCHEAGCPDAWRDQQRECPDCGRKFYRKVMDPRSVFDKLCHVCRRKCYR